MIKRSVRFPFAYLLPSADAEVVAKLLQHGIAVEKFEAPANFVTTVIGTPAGR